MAAERRACLLRVLLLWRVVYPLPEPAGKGHLPRWGYVFWIVVGAVPLALFARGEARRYHARTIARRVESYSGPEVPLRWLCNSVGMNPKDLAWYFENGYSVNLSLDLNQKMVRRRTVPRHDLSRG